MERISIKNVKHSEALSEETNAFTADVYLDNKKFGYAKNSGHGGCTFVHAYPDKRELFVDAEEYVKNLPKIEYGGLSIDSTLDLIIDLLLEKHLEAKDLKKHMTKALVFKSTDGKLMKVGFKYSIKKISESRRGVRVIQKEVDTILKEGGKILNTNLPKEVKYDSK